MFRALGFSLAAMLAIGTPAPASAADLSVVFVDPVSFTDATYSRWFTDDKARAAVLLGLEQHLQRLADRGLAAGDSLRIEVLDIRLAGGFEPFRSGSAGGVRILNEMTWPRMRLKYVLSRDGQVIASGQEQVMDMIYLARPNRYSTSDRLRYEKAMLDEWFDERIVAAREHG
jgi:hypothetical protein